MSLGIEEYCPVGFSVVYFGENRDVSEEYRLHLQGLKVRKARK
jgi:hypothetical protein